MLSYILRRLFLIIPTLLGMMIINFAIVQFAPGGPVEQIIAEMEGFGDATERISGSGADTAQAQQQAANSSSASGLKYQGSQGLSPEFIAELEQQFGFDKPPIERFLLMVGNYVQFDFGESYFKQRKVMCFHLSGESVLRLGQGSLLGYLNPFTYIPVKTGDCLVNDALPVSISLGLWMTLISYFISIPLGIKKAVRDGSNFDVWTSGIVIVGYAIPGFILGIFLIVFFAGGSFYQIFPLRGLTSDGFEQMSTMAQIADYFWHLALPLIALGVGAFATTTLLTKNSFLDEIGKQYVITAKAKGLSERRVLYGHVFRNAMLIIIAGFPGAFIGAFFAGSLLIEQLFSLNGLGLLGYEAIVNRDYPIVFGTLYIFGLMGLVINLISDVIYMLIDPRIDFESREI